MIDQASGTLDIKINNEIYKCWKVEYIKPLIVNYLKQKFPKSLVTFETDKIDILVMDDKCIPVEIQRTPLKRKANRIGFSHAEFEDSIRRQVEINIENNDVCWLFIDHEYIRYLKFGIENNPNARSLSVNLNWIVDLIRKEKLKVFTIKYDGTVSELKNFNFLKNISQTCPLGYDNDYRVLNRNKAMILRDTLIGHNFTQKEIDKIYEYITKNKNTDDTCVFLKKEENERLKLFGYILDSIDKLGKINEILDMKKTNLEDHSGKQYATILGIFEIPYGKGGTNSITKFVDKFGTCKYFPGYMRNDEKWNYLKDVRMSLKK